MSDEPLTTRIENHLSHMAPHVKQRMTATLLREALEEIRRLESLLYHEDKQ